MATDRKDGSAAAKKAHEEAKRIEPDNDIVKANDRWFR